MLRKEPRQTTFYTSLYDKIPKDHLLRRIDEAIDFSFVNDLLATRYSIRFGRPAKEPELMMKLLFLQHLYNLSDVRVIEEANVNLAYLCFLGLNPEDSLPDASLLAKFRTQRLKEGSLDAMLTEIVRQCIGQGLIKESTVSIDSTHIQANSTKKTPERIMDQLARRILKGLKADKGTLPKGIDEQIPRYADRDDHEQAKAEMERYLGRLIEQAAPYGGKKTKAAIAKAQELLADERFLQQKGVRSLSDTDARVGHKSKTDSFFGYKDEFVMTTDERIITAVDVYSGQHVDGENFGALMDRTLSSGLSVDGVFGDKAYFKAEVFKKLDMLQAQGYIPVNACSYQIKEDLFSYNKDSDEWFCLTGNRTVSKKRLTRNKNGKAVEYYRYTFDKQGCIACNHRLECMGKSTTKARSMDIALSTPLFYELSQQQKTPEFKEKYKKRASIEWKNGEMKRFHGLARARGWGLASVTTQAKLTAIAVNLKRIAALIGEKKGHKTSATCIFARLIRHPRALGRRYRDTLASLTVTWSFQLLGQNS
jgi:transposase